MATTAQAVIDDVEIILQDQTNTRWEEAELLRWLNLGQKAVVREKPDANPVIVTAGLVSGVWQTIPSTAIKLLDVICNLGTTGTTRGSAVTFIERKFIDASEPSWTNVTASINVKHVIYDPMRYPKKYLVYPKSTGTNYLELITSDLPTDVAAIGNNITIGDEYTEVLMDYICFRAFSKDAIEPRSAERAVAHYQNFLMMLGKYEAYESMFAPGKRDVI